MKKYGVEKIRNVAIIGHGGCGKTSLGEALLFTSGASTRLGRVDDGSSVFDYEPEEKSHNYSISTAFAYSEYKKHKINILDTPGYDVFLYDAQACLRAADAAVFVVSPEADIHFETEKLWRTCKEYDLPAIIFVNRLDKERSNFDAAVAVLGEKLDIPLVSIQLPIGSEAAFKGHVDLLSMTARIYKDESGNSTEEEIPLEILKGAETAREALVEHLVETDDELMEKYFDGQEISEAELREALKKGTTGRQFVPVLLGSAYKNIGADAVLDVILNAFPSPAERPAIKAADGEEERAPDEDAPFSALVFKTISDPFTGRLSVFRVFSGVLNSDSTAWNANKQSAERIGQIFALSGKDTKAVDQACAGDILAVPKLKDTVTGDTLCSKDSPIILSSSEPPEPLITFAAFAKNKGEEDKVVQGFKRMRDEDPTLRISRQEQTHEVLVSGMGRLHLDVVCERMKRKYGADADLKKPKVPYLETIKGSTKTQGRYKKQTGGKGQFGDTWIEIRPLPRGEGFKFNDKVVGGAIPKQYIPAVEEGIKEAMTHGVIAGYPMVDVEITLYDGKYHDVDSSEMAFKIAGSLGFKKGALECKPVLLEPIMAVVVEVPDEYMGDIIGDLNSRRGRVLGVDPINGIQIIKAHVPHAEMLMYSPSLRSMTSGRGTFTMKFDHYDEVPSHLADGVIAAAKAEHAEE